MWFQNFQNFQNSIFQTLSFFNREPQGSLYFKRGGCDFKIFKILYFKLSAFSIKSPRVICIWPVLPIFGEVNLNPGGARPILRLFENIWYPIFSNNLKKRGCFLRIFDQKGVRVNLTLLSDLLEKLWRPQVYAPICCATKVSLAAFAVKCFALSSWRVLDPNFAASAPRNGGRTPKSWYSSRLKRRFA